VVYGVLALFVFFLARMSIRYEMSKHPDPPYRVAVPFIKTVYILSAVAYIICVIIGVAVFHIPG
jgi:hypothetical protein